ncbi:TPA: polysaccharide biosynthesis protein, partial [Escherichia coli]
NIAGLSVSLIIRWFIADFKLDPLYLCIPIITTTFVPLLLRIIVFKIKSNFAYKLNNRNKLRYIKYHLKTGLNIVVSTISVAIYTRLSMFLLQFYMSSSAVAVFSVGASLAGSWYFVCNSFIISSLPSIFNDNNYKSSMRKTSLLHLYTVLLAIP